MYFATRRAQALLYIIVGGTCLFQAIGEGAQVRTHSAQLIDKRRARVERFLKEGKERLVDSDVWGAYRNFSSAFRYSQRRDPEATFYLAVTRLLAWPMRHQRAIESLGATGPKGRALQFTDLNPLRFMVELPSTFMGPLQFSRGAEVQRYLAQQLITELTLSQAQLNRIPKGFQSALPARNPLTGVGQIEIDDADIALCQAAISVALAQTHLGQVYNVDVETEDFIQRVQREEFGSPSGYLDNHPDLLHLQDPAKAQSARDTLVNAIDQYLAADALLQQETDDQTDDLFSFSTESLDLQRAATFRKTLQDVRTSLLRLTDSGWSLAVNQFLDLGDFFEDPIDLRSLDTGRGIQAALLPRLFAQSERALTNLRNAPVTFSEQVDPVLTGLRHPNKMLEIDYGDLLAIQTLLEGANTAMVMLGSYNIDVRIPEVAEKAIAQTLDVERDLLAPYPDVLRVGDFESIVRARLLGRRAIGAALSTSFYLRSLDDPVTSDELFQYEGRVAQWDAHLRPQLAELENSWAVIVDPSPNRTGDEFRLNLNPLFEQPLHPRDFLPQFNGVRPIKGTFPDPTLGGIVPDFTQETWK